MPGRNGKNSLSSMIFRSALMGQSFAIISLLVIIIAGFLYSVSREKKQLCDKATVAWTSDKDKILQLLVLPDQKLLRSELDRLMEEGEWSEVSIAPAEKTAPFDRVAVGSHSKLALSCTAEFSYLDQVRGIYRFQYPIKTFSTEVIKLFAALLAVLYGLYLIVVFQKKVVRKKILQPIGEIQENLRNLSGNATELSFSSTPECDELRNLQESIAVAFNENRKLRDDLESKKLVDEINKISMQVAHDIRSPLASLDMILEGLNQLPEEKRVQIRSAVSRIRDIANLLLKKARESTQKSAEIAMGHEKDGGEPLSIQLASTLVDSLLSEARAQYRDRIGIEIYGNLDSSSYGLFVKTQSNGFKTVLSNLINNSVEAIEKTGRISVSMSGNPLNVTITVQDNGKGIAPTVLDELKTRPYSHGKETGMGLGIFPSRAKVESWGGKLLIESEVGRGTKVSLVLPRATPPDWFVSRLELPANGTVVVLDDDDSIHHVWDRRLDSEAIRQKNIELVHLSSPDTLRAWVMNNGAGSTTPVVFLVDYELVGHRMNGLDLICELGIQKNAILVTSHYEEKAILSRCQLAKVRLIPKGMAGFVPISLVNVGSSEYGT